MVEDKHTCPESLNNGQTFSYLLSSWFILNLLYLVLEILVIEILKAMDNKRKYNVVVSDDIDSTCYLTWLIKGYDNTFWLIFVSLY